MPDDGVFLLAADRTTVLRGPVIEALMPLLTGRHTRREITESLADTCPPGILSRQIDRLLGAGLLVESEPVADFPAAAYWERSGADAAEAERRLAGARVRVTAVGGADAGPMAEALAAGGVHVSRGNGRLHSRTSSRPSGGRDIRPGNQPGNQGDGQADSGLDADLRVVVTGDLRAPDLFAADDEAKRSTVPWCVVKLSGPTAFLSPVLVPGRTACWTCAAHRLAGSHLEAAHVEAVTGGGRTVTAVPVGGAPVTQLTAHWASLLLIRWIAGVRGTGHDESDLSAVTFDTLSLNSARHRLVRRPQCPACGDPGLMTAQASRPVVVAEQGATGRGGRVLPPDAFLSAYGHLVSPVAGIVTDLTAQDTGLDDLHVCTAGHNFALHGPSTRRRRGALRGQSAGKGDTAAEARAGALGEAVERYSALWQGDEPRVRASLRSLEAEGTPFVHPDRIQLYSDLQYARRAEWNSSGSLFHGVPVRFDEDTPCDWTPVWSLTRQCLVHVPTAGLYYRYPHPPGRAFMRGDSNGSAAGGTVTEAVAQGLLELIERDSVALWWYNRVRRPAVAPRGGRFGRVAAWQEAYSRLGREAWVIDVTSDLDVPAAVAVSRRTEPGGFPGEGVLMGFGADLDMETAAAKAMREANQLLAAANTALADTRRPTAREDDAMVGWWRTATVADHPYLRPLPDGAGGAAGVPRAGAATGLVDALRVSVEAHGMEVLVADQTRPDIGLPVVKVLVPGLRHFWPRYAPGRLYDVPVRRGWLPAPTAEADLNPVAMFL